MPSFPWTDLTYGMSVDEVENRISGTSQGNGRRVVSGAKSLLKKDGLSIAGISFNAAYYFKDGAFSKIIVKEKDNLNPKEHKNATTLKRFEKLTSVIKKKYGKPTSHTLKERKSQISGRAEWMTSDGKIWMSIIPVTRKTAWINLGFNPSKSVR